MWESILSYFSTLEQHPVQRLILLVSGLLFFWVLEGAIPLIETQYKKNKTRHALINFSFTLMHLVIQTGIAVVIVLLADWCQRQNFGLVHWLNAGALSTIIISFFVYDLFIGWAAHFVQHQTFALWRFHTVHHADNNVDATTGLRHHPMESIVRGGFFLLATAVAGAPVYALMIYQTILVFFIAFTHANISLPRRLDKLLSWFFVSPNMHKVHHHWVQPYTDSNYGAVLSIWDRMFGTYRELDPSQLKYGLDRHYPNEHDENFWMLLKKPFQIRQTADVKRETGESTEVAQTSQPAASV